MSLDGKVVARWSAFEQPKNNVLARYGKWPALQARVTPGGGERPLFAAGRRSYMTSSVVWWIGVGVPPRGEAFVNGLGIAGWLLFAAGRRSYMTSSIACWVGVGAPPRGEAFVNGLGIAGWLLFAARRRSYMTSSVVWWVGVGAPPRGKASLCRLRLPLTLANGRESDDRETIYRPQASRRSLVQ